VADTVGHPWEDNHLKEILLIITKSIFNSQAVPGKKRYNRAGIE
jgi:hypothetical protein